MRRSLRLGVLTILLIIVSSVWVCGGADTIIENKKITNQQVFDVYRKIVAATGQTQDALPLKIDSGDDDNAYNNGAVIVIYRGLIDRAKSVDEIALVLGHEVAHGMLGHLGKLNTDDKDEVTVLEGNADKMGAVYMMKAGYDVCKGRMLYTRWLKEGGEALNQNHPPDAYRWAELNIGCGEV